jgi:CBS domain-containing protein
MGAVSNLLDSKGSNVLTVKPDTVVKDALTEMADLSAGTSLVMDGGKVVGVLSERDVIRKVVLTGKNASEVLSSEVMTTNLITVSPETKLDECMQLMTEKRIRHLPVLRDGNLCGIVSIGDVVKYLLIEKNFKIKNLETYISGSM